MGCSIGMQFIMRLGLERFVVSTVKLGACVVDRIRGMYSAERLPKARFISIHSWCDKT